MGKFAGGFLRIFSTVIYFIEFCCAAIGLALYSYFLAKLSYHDRKISQNSQAVEGLTGAGVVYTIFAVILTCFLGGNRFFGILAIVLNVLFCGGFIAVAILTRDGADSCSANIVTTPLGKGPPNLEGPAGTHLGLACRLNTAVFATAIIAALLFVVSIVLQFFIIRNHQNEKKYGPSPANNYTSGRGDRKFWQRKPKTTRDAYGNEMSAAGGFPPTNGTSTTGTDPYSDNSSYKPDNSLSGYHTGPVGQSVNPYGYSNQANPGTNY